MRDNDRGNCRDRKASLLDRVAGTGRENQTKIRIVCQELEAWVIGDLKALESAKGPISTQIRNAAVDPDSIPDPVQLLERHYGSYPKIESAAEIAAQMTIDENTSTSFRAFFEAVNELTGDR